MPEAQPVTRLVDDCCADIGSLVHLGLVEPQPTPRPSITPFLEPSYPDLPDGYLASDEE